jgi:hypothetical protein
VRLVQCFHIFSSNPTRFPKEHPHPQKKGCRWLVLVRPSTQQGAWTRTLAAPITPRTKRSVKLLRKEVIQPHLPVRLPCYDFVPIASPTFDRSPPHGLGHGLRVLPTFVT